MNIITVTAFESSRHYQASGFLIFCLLWDLGAVIIKITGGDLHCRFEKQSFSRSLVAVPSVGELVVTYNLTRKTG